MWPPQPCSISWAQRERAWCLDEEEGEKLRASTVWKESVNRKKRTADEKPSSRTFSLPSATWRRSPPSLFALKSIYTASDGSGATTGPKSSTAAAAAASPPSSSSLSSSRCCSGRRVALSARTKHARRSAQPASTAPAPHAAARAARRAPLAGLTARESGRGSRLRETKSEDSISASSDATVSAAPRATAVADEEEEEGVEELAAADAAPPLPRSSLAAAASVALIAERASDAAMPPKLVLFLLFALSTALSATLVREDERASRTPLSPSAASRAPPAASRAGRRDVDSNTI